MPALEKRPTGWRIVWREGGAGSKKHYSATFPSKKAAGPELAAIEARLVARKAPTRLVIPLAEVRLRWIAHLEAAGRTPLHIAAVTRSLARSIPAKAHTTADLVKSPRPYDQRVLRAFARFARRDLGQTIPDLVDRAPPAAKRKPRRDQLTPEQVAAIIDAATAWHPADGALLHLIAWYGHRAESLVELPLDAVQGDHLVVRVKSGDVIRHPLAPASLAILRPLRDRPEAIKHGRLLVGHLGEPWASGVDFAGWLAHSIIKPGTRPVGTPRGQPKGGRPRRWPEPAPGSLVKAGILDLRRFAISRMLAAGLDAVTVASITGHRTVSLLWNTYGRTTQDRQAAAVATIQAMQWPQMSPRG